MNGLKLNLIAAFAVFILNCSHLESYVSEYVSLIIYCNNN